MSESTSLTAAPKPDHGACESGEIKDMRSVRSAYAHRDLEASKMEHAKKHVTGEMHATGAGDYVKSIVFGGLDGIMTTFAIVAAAAGANEGWRMVLVFGFSNAVADAWAMGFGEFVSGNAERDHALTEREREEWEVEHNIDGEIAEMQAIYRERGFTPEDSDAMVGIISKYPKQFVDIMMVDELGILVDLDDPLEPLKQGAVMFLSFIVFGIFPLVAYLGRRGQGADGVFMLACAITGLGLMLLGGIKGYLTGVSVPKTALTMLVNGVVSGGVSYGLGVAVNYALLGKAV